MKLIKLSKGKFAKVDDDKFDWLNQWKWSASKSAYNWYAVRNDKGHQIYMHRFIMNCPVGKEVDHGNRDSLDNQIDNLEICDGEENLKRRKWENKK